MKNFCILLFICLLCFTGCNNSTQNLGEEIQSVSGNRNEEDNIDIDLSILSSTMIYAEIYNITMNNQDYIDKTIKISGTFSSFYEKSSGLTYYSILVMDETACCSTGFELEFSEDVSLNAEDFPKHNEQITIIGTFDTYDYYGMPSCILKNAYFV